MNIIPRFIFFAYLAWLCYQAKIERAVNSKSKLSPLESWNIRVYLVMRPSDCYKARNISAY